MLKHDEGTRTKAHAVWLMLRIQRHPSTTSMTYGSASELNVERYRGQGIMDRVNRDVISRSRFRVLMLKGVVVKRGQDSGP